MIQLFLKYNALKFIPVFVLLLVVRLFAYKMSIPFTDDEVTWLLVGERMADGFTLYKDIWTDLEPFSAITYYLIDLIFGKSRDVYFVLSLLLVFLQSVIFTRGLNKNKVFKESSALPALIYILYSSLFFDFYTLSPVLMGTTFILWVFNMICFQSRVTTTEDRFFYIGLLTGIATLFYFPFALFLFFALAALGLYSNTNLKQQMVLVLAFFFPFIVLLIYYFWIDNLGNYLEYSIYPTLYNSTDFEVDFPTIIKIIVLPFLLLLTSSAAIAIRGRYIHYQYILIKIMGLWLLAGVLAIALEKTITPHLLVLFVPPLAFFTSHLFLIFSKNKIVSELAFLIMFGGILLISFYSLWKPDNYTQTHLIKTLPEEAARLNIKNKRIIVLGKNKEFYINNTISGPYVNWSLASWQFEDLRRYASIAAIYEEMETGKPEYIIDTEKRMAKISEVIPEMKKQYERIDTTAFYRRRF